MFEKLKRLLSLFFKGNSLDYICGSEALPLPFSQEEESDKISRLESGDEKARRRWWSTTCASSYTSPKSSKVRA